MVSEHDLLQCRWEVSVPAEEDSSITGSANETTLANVSSINMNVKCIQTDGTMNTFNILNTVEERLLLLLLYFQLLFAERTTLCMSERLVSM